MVVLIQCVKGNEEICKGREESCAKWFKNQRGISSIAEVATSLEGWWVCPPVSLHMNSFLVASWFARQTCK
jgi:hypothetical protein